MEEGSSVLFHKLTVKRRVHDVIIGHEASHRYLTIEEEGLKIIEYLRKHTIGETQTHFPHKDVHAFVELLAAKGMIYRINHRVLTPRSHVADILDIPAKYLGWTQSNTFQGIILGFIITGFIMLLIHPSLLPTPNWFFFTGWYGVLLPLAFIVFWAIQFFHELGHYIVMKPLGYDTGLTLVHKWHLLLPHTNLRNVRLLAPHKRAKVLLGGVAADGVIFGIGSLFVVAGIGVAFWQFVMLFAFLNILFQLIPFRKTDIIQATEHIFGVKDILKAWQETLKEKCPGCKPKKLTKKEQFAVERSIPLFVIGSLVLIALLLFYVIPIFAFLIGQLASTLVVGAIIGDIALFTDSFLALLFVTVFLSFYFVATIRDHKYSTRNWFTWINLALFTLANYFSVFLIAIAMLFFASPPFVMVSMLFLGFIFGMLFMYLLEHVQVDQVGFTKGFFIPVLAVFTAIILAIMLNIVGIQSSLIEPRTIYAISYALGMMGTMMF